MIALRESPSALFSLANGLLPVQRALRRLDLTVRSRGG